MKIRMLEPISGQFHGYTDVKRGDVVEVDDDNGARYCALNYAVAVVNTETAAVREERTVEKAVLQESVETAAVEAPPEPETPAVESSLPTPLDEQEDSTETDESDDSTASDTGEAKKPAPRRSRR